MLRKQERREKGRAPWPFRVTGWERNDNKEDRSINPRHIVLPLLPSVVFILILLPLLPLSLRVLLGVCLLIGLVALAIRSGALLDVARSLFKALLH
jgi:hypothetical protein